MATIRTMANQILIGRVGQTTYYARKGQQVARQSRNNSNFGDGASRTEAQMSRRVKWSNLVNLYKNFAYWMPKAFEGAQGGVTVYNRFMSLNVPLTAVNLTKSQAQSGASVLEAVYISRGQLPSIAVEPSTNFIASSVSVGDFQLEAASTVGDLSAAILQNNSNWQDGDNLAWVNFFQDDDELGVPHVTSEYYEMTLDTTSTVLLSSLDATILGGLSANTSYVVISRERMASTYAGAAFVHTRKVNGSLKVSTQRVKVFDAATYTDYTTPQSEQMAIDSYGVDQSVPLDPGF